MSGYTSSVLRCNIEEDGCLVCQFLNGDRSEKAMLEVIRILDAQLADMEKHAKTLQNAWLHQADKNREARE